MTGKRFLKAIAVAVSIFVLHGFGIARASAAAPAEVFRSKNCGVLAYSADSTEIIEGSIVGDSLLLKRKGGKVEELNMSAMNSDPKNQTRFTWNLFLFFIGKDIWRGLRLMKGLEQEHILKKAVGQANISLLVNSDCTYKILKKVIYIPGQAPCTNENTNSATRDFWRQMDASIKNVAFKSMKIPDRSAESVTIDLIMGRDYEKFPRYPAGAYKGDYVLRDPKTKAMRRVTRTAK
jgi:hypothetical protein